MAVMQASPKGSSGLHFQEDGKWLQKVLDLIPRSVYGEDATRSGNREDKESDSQKSGKGNVPKKRRGSKGQNGAQTTERKDVGSSRHEDQRKKLHEKIMEKRAERKADDESFIEARSAKKRRRDEKASLAPREGKRTRSEKENQRKNKRKKEREEAEGSETTKTRKRKRDGDEEQGGSLSLETTRISGFETDKPARKAKRRKLKGPKLLELQKKLEEVTKQTEANNGEKESRTGDENQKQGMEKAMQRAQGIEVKDDAKKLRKSIRREKRKTEKSREEWAKRTKSQEMEKKVVQEKKAKNLEERKAKKRSTKK